MKQLPALAIFAILVFLICIFPSCAETVQPSPSAGPTPSPTTEVKPDEKAYTFTAADGATATERRKLQVAASHINRVLQSECFEKWLAKAPIDFAQTDGRNRAKLLRHLRESAPAVVAHFYYRKPPPNVVGYRKIGGGYNIHLNRYYFNTWHTCTWGSTILHETSHAMGYDHDYKLTKSRPYSVPYQLNRAMERCCK
jgi:hypothetical protein